MRNKIFIITIIFSLFLLLFFSSCATFKKEAVTSIKNAAVVSVYCHKRIDTSDFKGMAAGVSELAQNKDFKLQPVAVRLRDDIFNEYASHLPFSLLDEPTVINNESYINLYKDKKIDFKPIFFATPEGYQIVLFTNEDIITKLFESFPEVDGLVFVNADFRLDKVASVLGFGTAKVRATHTLMVIDRNREIVMKKHNYASSKGSLKFALGGVFDAGKIQPLCVEAINRAADTTKKWIQKEMSK